MYRRGILKLTGEVFSNSQRLQNIAKELKYCVKNKFQLVIVVGGGNFFRGRDAKFNNQLIIDRAGMLGTVINGILLEYILRPTAIHLSALNLEGMIESYQVEKALKYLKDNKIVIVSGGSGLPYFSTDTASALRALELNADVILKATNVDGIYSADPKISPNAKLLKTISYEQAIKQNLKVIDQQAFALLKDHPIPIVVFNVFKENNLKKILKGEKIGSLVC
ncbi:MAG: uridine monophosphate kinase [candidate division WOR-3 bacterium]